MSGILGVYLWKFSTFKNTIYIIVWFHWSDRQSFMVDQWDGDQAPSPLVLDQETKMQHKFDPTSPTHSNYRYHWPFLYLGPSLYSVISFPPIPIVPTPTWKREIVSKKKSRFGRTRLSSRLLRGLENAFLHKAFLAKCFFTEVLPLPLFFLTLERESYI